MAQLVSYIASFHGRSYSSVRRLYFIDNLRIFLTALVVLHHLAITYGAPGDWYYTEGQPGFAEGLFFSWFVATNQAFFMGLFFFIAAYFTEASFNRKGERSFIADRLKRLGIPLVIYFFLLAPLTVYLRELLANGATYSFLDLFKSGNAFGFGPMWFVEALIYFSIFYLLYRAFASPPEKCRKPVPSTLKVVLLILFLGIGTFLIRIQLPVGWSLKPLSLQLPHFLQYVCFFTLGILAYRHRWLDHLTRKTAKDWMRAAQVAILVLFPLVFYIGTMNGGSIEPFMGGFTWQSFAFSFWEQFVGVALSLGILGLFQHKFAFQGKFAQDLAASAYTVYIIHPVILVALALWAKDLNWGPSAKFLVLAPIALIMCFGLASLIRKLPGARRIL